MSHPCASLGETQQAGVYKLGCTPDELRGYVAEAGFVLFDVDLAQSHGKGEFLAAVARAIAAPGWFGHNLDALADALGDLSWQPAPGYVLLLRNGGDLFGLGGAEHEAVMDILSDAAAFWKSQGKPFWAFFC